MHAKYIGWVLVSDRRILMQISFQLSGAPLQVCALSTCMSLLLLFPSSLHCDPYASTWAFAPNSSLRLIAAEGGPVQSAYHAGIEIRLDPGALTYWRMPGAAGAPPVFSFEGSTNAAEIVVSYPAPMRIDEDGIEAFGYRNKVTFPLRITPKDLSRPVLLMLNLSYAVCAQICIPARGEASLTLVPGQESKTANQEAAVIAAAEALVPVHLTLQEGNAKVAIARVETASSPSWRVSARSGSAQDLFVEAPPGWSFDTHKTGQPNEFLIVEAERPSARGSMRPPVTLTVKDENQSYEFVTGLDAASPLARDVHAEPTALSQAGHN
jgi:DsbC/DsbD-like thiol-disulfide interchange protein